MMDFSKTTHYSEKKRSLLSVAWERFCRFFFFRYCRLVVKNIESLPKPPFILCSNHCSHLDTPVLMLSTEFSFNRFGIVVAKDYFFGPKKNKRWLQHIMNLIPLDRRPDRKTVETHIRECREFLDRNGGVLIFYPEGTRSRTGDLQKLKKGAAQYAYELQVPLVPAYIDGTFQSMRKGRRFPKPTTISVRFGKPIYVKESGLKVLREVTAELETELIKLRDC